MRKIILLASLCALASADCAYKIERLENKLEIAKRYGNTGEIRGLENALLNARAHCGAYARSLSEYDKFSPAAPGIGARYDAALAARLDALEDDYERREDAIEDELDELDDRKHSMSKAEYKRAKRALKDKKRAIKAEYKRAKRELKYGI